MKLDEAIRQVRQYLKEHKDRPFVTIEGVSHDGLIIPPGLLDSNDWTVTFRNTDPELSKAVGQLFEELKDGGSIVTVLQEPQPAEEGE